jgi:hypothetical protein
MSQQSPQLPAQQGPALAQTTAALPPTTIRLLQDKFYDKRKQAALEIEKYNI